MNDAIPTFEFRFENTTEASPEVVFDIVSDGAGYARWSSCDESSVERTGSPTPHGIGAIRVLHSGVGTPLEIHVRELTNHYWPPYLFGYKVLDESVVVDHQGIVLFEGFDGATKVTWHVTCSPADPTIADVLKQNLDEAFETLLSQLCAEATLQARAAS